MAIDPYRPLEGHSAAELVEEIRRLNQVCYAHELAREHLELEVSRLAQVDAEKDRTELSGFWFGLLVGLTVLEGYILFFG